MCPNLMNIKKWKKEVPTVVVAMILKSRYIHIQIKMTLEDISYLFSSELENRKKDQKFYP